jgi:hypothetical protein
MVTSERDSSEGTGGVSRGAVLPAGDQDDKVVDLGHQPRLLQVLRRSLRQRLSVSPWYLPIRRLVATSGDNLASDTELVIEGFPRSGNTFAEAAFRKAASQPVKLAHHSHAAAQVVQAVKWKLPCLVLIREPVEAARSLLMHHPETVSEESCLREYSSFYETVRPARAGYVLARFDTLTRDVGVVIDAVNRRFNTSFEKLTHTPATELAIFDMVDELGHSRGTTLGENEPYSPRASQESKLRREGEKNFARELFKAQRFAKDVARARAIYNFLSKSADV